MANKKFIFCKLKLFSSSHSLLHLLPLVTTSSPTGETQPTALLQYSCHRSLLTGLLPLTRDQAHFYYPLLHPRTQNTLHRFPLLRQRPDDAATAHFAPSPSPPTFTFEREICSLIETSRIPKENHGHLIPKESNCLVYVVFRKYTRTRFLSDLLFINLIDSPTYHLAKYFSNILRKTSSHGLKFNGWSK